MLAGLLKSALAGSSHVCISASTRISFTCMFVLDNRDILLSSMEMALLYFAIKARQLLG